MDESLQPTLPQGWEWTTLGEICSPPQYGWTTKAVSKKGIHLLRTTDITSGSINWDDVPYCFENPPDPSKYILKDGDIVISRAGSVGYSYLVNNPRQAVFASYLIRFRPLINPKYVAYFLKSPYYWQQITEQTLGISIPNVNASKLKELAIPLPPLPEQERIVARIEALLSHVEAGEACLRRAQVNLKRARASLLQAATTGRLTHPHLPPGDLPPGWVWSTVGEVSVIKGGKRLPKGHGYSEIPTACPYIRVTDFSDYGINQQDLRYLLPETQKMISRYIIHINDVYISIAGSIGKVGMIPENLNGANLTENAARITEIKGMAPKFLMYSLSSPDGVQQIEKSTISTNQPKLALLRIAQLRIPKPSLSEQEKIVLEIDRQLSSIQMAEVTTGQQIMRSRRLRQSILSAAFSGQL